MPGSCCAKPIATIIKVGNSEAGIVGLEAALQSVYISGGNDDQQIKAELLQCVKRFGNYIAPSCEHEYKEALLREYRKYVATAARKAPQGEGSKQ